MNIRNGKYWKKLLLKTKVSQFGHIISCQHKHVLNFIQFGVSLDIFSINYENF